MMYMIDDSVAMARDVERHYLEPSDEVKYEGDKAAFINAAQSGRMDAPAPFNYGFSGATVADMMEHSFSSPKWDGVKLSDIFKYLGELSKGDDQAMALLEKMAAQFIWKTSL